RTARRGGGGRRGAGYGGAAVARRGAGVEPRALRQDAGSPGPPRRAREVPIGPGGRLSHAPPGSRAPRPGALAGAPQRPPPSGTVRGAPQRPPFVQPRNTTPAPIIASGTTHLVRPDQGSLATRVKHAQASAGHRAQRAPPRSRGSR